jgi:putative tricarboxylic transport membrane protein
MSVALITLTLLVAVAALFSVKRPSYVFYDSEREWRDDRPVRSDLHFQGWMLAMLAGVAVFGFVLGIFIFITIFLRVKAGTTWHRAVIGALGAVALFSALGHFLVLEYPAGLLQWAFELPWPLE